MNKELVVTQDIIGEIFSASSPTISTKSLQKIYDRLPELHRAKLAVGRRNSQTTATLQTMNIISDGPYRQMKQCLSQIDNKRQALVSLYYKIKKDRIKVKQWLEKDNELLEVMAEELQARILMAQSTAENSLKEIGMYQDLYDAIRESHNIDIDWDEADFEEAEVSNHLHLAFRQAVQDVIVGGNISKGIAEYLEQYGVNPIVGNHVTRKFVIDMQKECNNGKLPSVKELHKFLDLMAETFKDEHLKCLNRMGVDKIVNADYITKNRNKHNE